MKIGSRSEGFTIVETLIVLAVTGFLFLIAAVAINGKTNKTEFQTGTRDIQSRLQQVANEVSAGYYPNNGSFKCSASAGAPTISGGSAAQGTNKDCIFLGKVVQFNVSNQNPEQMYVYSVIGLREISPGSGNLVTTLAQANPRIITLGGTYDVYNMPAGMTTVPAKTDAGAVGFISNLNSLDTLGPSQQVDVYPLSGVSSGTSMASAIATITGNSAQSLKSTAPNPNGGVHWCVKSGGTNQSVYYTIGGQGRELTISMDIKNGTAC